MRAVDALITGATGLIGTHVAAELAAEGRSVRCLVRPSSDTAALRHAAPQADLVQADLSSDGEVGADLAGALSGAKVVLHLAGRLHAGSPFGSDESDAEYQLNVESTRGLLEASRAAGVERFVYASSVAVYDPDAVSPISEDGPALPRSAYGRSKLAAERLVFEYHQRGLPGTVVRPTIVYGAGDRLFLPVARGLTRLSLLPMLGGGRNLVDVAAAEDVATVLVAAAFHPGAPGQIYNAASGHPTSPREMLEVLRAVDGTPIPRVVGLPPLIMRLLAPLGRSVLSGAVPGMEGMAGALATRYGRRDVFYDMGRVADQLGVRPRHDFHSGLLAARETERARNP